MPDQISDTEKGHKVTTTPSIDDAFLVAFKTPTDPSNPKDWPLSKKWIVTIVLSSTGFNRIMVSTIIAPALPTIRQELHMSNIESVMAMSVYLLATAFGPLVIGPLSELYGRRPVLHATNIWFLIWNIVCGFAQTKGTLIAARFLAGFGSSAIYALAGGVMGDVWRPEQRGRSLGLYSLIPLLGAAVGPIIGGYIAQYSTWRWMFWSTSILQAVMVVISLPLFHETHAPTILRHMARLLVRSLTRPVRLLLFHPMVQINALLSAFQYGLLYLVLSTFSDLWTTQYHESISTSGLHYISLCLGEIVGAQLGGPLMDYMYSRMNQHYNNLSLPEFRMPFMIPGAILTPLGLFIYGWAAQKHTHWIVVDIGGFVASFGMQIIGQALQAYMIDSYPEHTSSASAASQFLRSLTAFGFPLFAPRMYDVLGYGWGNSLLGFVAIVIGLPAPIGIWFYGARLRAKALSSF
ncbi:efflux pump antibiotic resistance protein [Rutstroemia sp. NJR-2017a BBW]|nr:efflux pump antibiotic resistance protein [Rutstroemia sp. NJR-2017a BBW]